MLLQERARRRARCARRALRVPFVVVVDDDVLSDDVEDEVVVSDDVDVVSPGYVPADDPLSPSHAQAAPAPVSASAPVAASTASGRITFSISTSCVELSFTAQTGAGPRR